MLKYKVGDLIEAAQSGEVMAIAHCCNCLNTMGSGIAPLIKHAFPSAYQADQETLRGDYGKLGTFSLGEEETLWVYNLYGQYGYSKRKTGGRDLNYNALYDALCAMADDLHSYDKGGHGAFPVGLPMLGAGLAKGDWDIISLMIEKTLIKAGHDVTVYVLDENQIPEGAVVID